MGENVFRVVPELVHACFESRDVVVCKRGETHLRCDLTNRANALAL